MLYKVNIHAVTIIACPLLPYVSPGAAGHGYARSSRVPGASGAVRHLNRATVPIRDSRCML